MGKPEYGYPWKWSIYRWLEGEIASYGRIADLSEFAGDLGNFLIALHKINATDGPSPGLHRFYRGGSLSVYDNDTRRSTLT
jgi:aminoglycoside phosphotransferase (APT) family kinase protein